MKIVKDLGYNNLVDYVLENSFLEKGQFDFVLRGGDGYAYFAVVQDGKINYLGAFSYDRFIRQERPIDLTIHKKAITVFLNLCIQKLKDPEIQVPDLYGNSDLWDECYEL